MSVNKQAVVGIIKRIFTYYGYSVNYSDISDFLAEKNADHLFVKYDTSANFNSIRHFSNNVGKYGGKGILILDSVDEKTRSFALNEGITVWDRGELESWVGRAVLSGALEETRMSPAQEPLEEEKEVFSTLQPQIPEKIPVVSEKNEFERTIRILLRSVPINIGKADALSIAQAKVGSSRSQKLKFIPVWHYHYSFSTQKKFKSRIIDLAGDGGGFINALTGTNSFSRLKDVQDSIFVPTQNYEIRQPIIAKNDALDKALDAIIREHAKEIRLNEMIGDTIIFENKIFAPEEGDINLEMELIHIPMWEIKGSAETAEINGYDGHVEALKAYSDAEFV